MCLRIATAEGLDGGKNLGDTLTPRLKSIATKSWDRLKMHPSANLERLTSPSNFDRAVYFPNFDLSAKVRNRRVKCAER